MVELMVTLSVAAILLLVAVPSFRTITLSNRLTTAANQVVDAINAARVEAIKRNNYVQLCGSTSTLNTSDTLGTACGSTTSGTVMALGVDSSGNTTTDTIQNSPPGIATPLQLSGSFAALRFNGQGLGAQAGSSSPYTGNVVLICTTNLGTDNQRLISIAAGSVVQVQTSTGTCS
jgi:type IV fimbrial biogenesis protein FimT